MVEDGILERNKLLVNIQIASDCKLQAAKNPRLVFLVGDGRRHPPPKKSPVFNSGSMLLVNVSDIICYFTFDFPGCY